MAHELVLIMDFGGQLNQLLARRIRDLGVYCEVHPYKISIETIKEKNPIGIVFTGGSDNVNLDTAIKVQKEIFELGIPVLGVEYGGRMMMSAYGAEFENLEKIKSVSKNNIVADSAIFKGISDRSFDVYSTEIQKIKKNAEGFIETSDLSYENSAKQLYVLQFHPEVSATENGKDMLKNFLFEVCKAKADWSMKAYAQTAINDIRETVGDGKVLLALSGGVDSSVVAALLEKAVGDQLTCIFVDHGLMRKNEGDEVEEAFGNGGMKFIRVNAQDRFLEKLAGVTDPEQKRKIIGEEFIRVFEDEAKKIGKVDYLAQGTIYPDIIESDLGDGTVIKSHHNVGGLPDKVDFKELVEPLRLLFKDEVRMLGEELGVPSYLVWRQPFPGPGLGIRVIGDITKEKLDILRDADYIFRDEIAKAGLDRKINQYFVVLTSMRSVGVSQDMRTYDYTVALRGVITTDFMTAEWAKIPFEVLENVSTRIVKEVDHINRVVYDITGKPPATIEWE